MWYISPDIADKLLPVAARGDIEGIFLAIMINLTIMGLIAVGIAKSVTVIRKYIRHQNKSLPYRHLKR